MLYILMTTKQSFWRTLAVVAAMLLTVPATLWAQTIAASLSLTARKT